MTPKVLIIGGPDVNQRIGLMNALRPDFEFVAVGSGPGLASDFVSAGYGFRRYHLSRGFQPLSDLLAFVQLYRICRAERPQVVHTFDTKPSVIGRAAAIAASVPVVLGTLPGLGSLYSDDGMIRRVVRQVYEHCQWRVSRRSDLTVFQNEADRQEYLEKGLISVADSEWIPGSGVQVERFSPQRVPADMRMAVRRELGIPENAVLVTMVGRIIRSKGVVELAAAATEVAESHCDVKFLLVGSLDQGSPDRLSAQELRRVDAAVHRIGFRDDIDVVLAASDVFVLPTFLREGLPRVLLEAAAMELAIVTTAMPGCSEFVRDGIEGIIVPPHDVPRLVGAIRSLVSDERLRCRLGRAARQRVVGTFDLSTVSAGVRALYGRLLAMKHVSLENCS